MQQLLILPATVYMTFAVIPGAKALDKYDLQSLEITVHNLCVQPDEKGYYLKVEGNLDNGASLKVAGVKTGASVTREQWDGIGEQLKYKTDPRECAIKLMGILAPLLSGKQNVVPPEPPPPSAPAAARCAQWFYDYNDHRICLGADRCGYDYDGKRFCLH